MTVAKINDSSNIRGGSNQVTLAGDDSCPITECDCEPPSIRNFCEYTELTCPSGTRAPIC